MREEPDEGLSPLDDPPLPPRRPPDAAADPALPPLSIMSSPVLPGPRGAAPGGAPLPPSLPAAAACAAPLAIKATGSRCCRRRT